MRFTGGPPPAVVNGIITPAVVTTDNDWMTLDATGGLAPFTAYANADNPADTSPAGWVAANNVRMRSQFQMAVSRTVNSLNLQVPLNITAGSTLTLVSGGLLASNSGTTCTISGGAIAIGADAPDLVVQTRDALTISSQLALGAKALTLASPNGLWSGTTITLTNPANQVGDVFVTNGTLLLQNAGALGSPFTGALHLFGSTLAFPSTTNITLAKPLVVARPKGVVTLFTSATLSGGGTLYGTLFANLSTELTAPVGLTLSGDYDGPGGLDLNTVRATNFVRATGHNAYAGGTLLRGGGSLSIGSDTALGTGPLEVQNGRLQAVDAPRSLPNDLRLTGPYSFSVSGDYDLTFGGSLTIDNGTLQAIAVGPGRTLTFAGPLIGGRNGVRVTDGRLVINSDSPSFTGLLVVGSGGTVRLNGQIPNASTVLVNGTLELGGSQTFPVLSVSGGATVKLAAGRNVLTARFLSNSGKIDLADGALIYDHDGTLGPATVRDWLVSGRHGGAWDGATGITSSAVVASDPARAVGFADAATLPHLAPTQTGTFHGRPVDATTILVAYTIAGDATLDGVVDFNDLVQLAQNYNTTLPAANPWWWSSGDFDYDGKCDFNDLVKLAQNYNTALPTTPIPGAPTDFTTDLAAAFATVPEPSAIGVTALAAVCVSARRRRARPTPIPPSHGVATRTRPPLEDRRDAS